MKTRNFFILMAIILIVVAVTFIFIFILKNKFKDIGAPVDLNNVTDEAKYNLSENCFHVTINGEPKIVCAYYDVPINSGKITETHVNNSISIK